MNLLKKIKNRLLHQPQVDKRNSIFKKYEKYSMIPQNTYLKNLKLLEQYKHIEGCIVECGVWRGGMIAGIADILADDRNYYLFDSFEGLPPTQEIDGKAATEWQNEKTSPIYFDNCKAEITFAETAMKMSKATNYSIVKGWFSDTLPTFKPSQKIAFLRMDGDWYSSTMECLENLYPHVVCGGIIIIDDYYVWEGCAKAVHDYLSKNNSSTRIMQYQDEIAFLIKKD